MQGTVDDCVSVSLLCQVTKEVKSGQYRLTSYFLAKTLVSVPFETVIAIIFTVIIYFMIGFQAKLYKFLIFMITLVLVNLISEMVGFIGGVVTKVIKLPPFPCTDIVQVSPLLP